MLHSNQFTMLWPAWIVDRTRGLDTWTIYALDMHLVIIYRLSCTPRVKSWKPRNSSCSPLRGKLKLS